MKHLVKFYAVVFILFSPVILLAQPATIKGSIDSLKDAWGTSFTYIGELKGGKPNGLGIAVYNSETVVRYAGYFVNGLFEGKGALLYKNGAFLYGDWKNGKSYGQGTYYNKDKDLYSGGFLNGLKNGAGIYIYGDNSISKGQFNNDTYNGRLIFINGAGTTICDNMYVDGKKHGAGYQYELETKKLFEGTWKQGAWDAAAPVNFNTFLKSSSFYSEKNDNQLLAGGIDKNNKNLLEDTAFFYDLKNKKRYFGYFHTGNLERGIILRDDSSRFIGTVNTSGANGFGRFLKMDKYYNEGNYENDFLTGPNNLNIDLVNKTVYYGQTVNKGEFTGRAFYANNFNDLYSGNFEKGNYSGEGWRIDKKGYCLTGTWQNGELIVFKSLTDERGEAVNLKPKTMTEALATVSKMYSDNFYAAEGKHKEKDAFSSLYNDYEGLISFPGSLENIVNADPGEDFFYTAVFKTTSDFEEAKKKYAEIANQVKNAAVVLKKGTAPQKLLGDIIMPANPADFTISQFTFSNAGYEYSTFAVSVAILKNSDNKYAVVILCSDKEAATWLK